MSQLAWAWRWLDFFTHHLSMQASLAPVNSALKVKELSPPPLKQVLRSNFRVSDSLFSEKSKFSWDKACRKGRGTAPTIPRIGSEVQTTQYATGSVGLIMKKTDLNSSWRHHKLSPAKDSRIQLFQYQSTSSMSQPSICSHCFCRNVFAEGKGKQVDPLGQPHSGCVELGTNQQPKARTKHKKEQVMFLSGSGKVHSRQCWCLESTQTTAYKAWASGFWVT